VNKQLITSCADVPLSNYLLTHPARTRPKVETVAVFVQKLQDAWLCTKSMGLCLH